MRLSSGIGAAAAAVAAVAASGGGSGGSRGVAGLGGGVGFYGYSNSRRASATLASSPSSHSWSQHGPVYRHQQKVARSGRSTLRVASQLLPGPVQPQVLPLQPPPVVLPCPAAVPDNLPSFKVSVHTYRLGRYNFKGASAPIAMVEVTASHFTPRRLQLQDAALLPHGPKGGLVEAQQGLVDEVQGVGLPGLARVYKHLYQERVAAAAAAAAAAAPYPTVEQRKPGFGVHRLLRASLQQQQDVAAGAGKGGSVSSSASLAANTVARLTSLVSASSATGGGRRSGASVTSSGSLQADRGGSSSGGGGAGAGGGGGGTAADACMV